MELPSTESQGIAVEKQAQPPYNLRKRKRSPSSSKDQKENEKLPRTRSKIPMRETCLPILPPESKITKKFSGPLFFRRAKLYIV